MESEAIADAFRDAGFFPGSRGDFSGEQSGIIIINTCTVTTKADQKARRIIRKALRDNPSSCVLVTGCYAQLESEAIKSLESECSAEGRLFVFRGDKKGALLDLPRYLQGADIKDDISALVKSYSGNNSNPDNIDIFNFAPEHFSFHSRGFLKIQDGCDRHCTYCRTRLARGTSRSLDADLALKELQRLEGAGYAEAVLTGLNITDYRSNVIADNGREINCLGGLLEYLLSETQCINIRLSSLEPDGIDGKLAEVLPHKRIRSHFHLSVQSGSEKILSEMGRGYGSETVECAAALFRTAKDDPFLACDIIAGFPGETEDDFNKTLDLCRRIDFAWIHVFPFSRRPGTAAFSFPQQVPEKDTAKRVEILMELAREGRRRYVQRWIGRELEAVVEQGRISQAGYCRGVSENYLKLLARFTGDNPPAPGSVLHCRVMSAPDERADYDAVAEESFSIKKNQKALDKIDKNR
ncbi:MAG: tRNA (N(6)-L-threonylcarbamoyladenosine(37)-C(2))-methylthiotransferase MtaB [Treponema sp.]|nr:tRNA (N(6)-L-threonylcarbamoyladenosine(37)-C(2))-methylthiotransferase MtaB [Treponema sp.]